MEPEELLLVAVVKLSIRNAQQQKDERLRADAVRWLWVTALRVAEMAEVPPLDAPLTDDVQGSYSLL